MSLNKTNKENLQHLSPDNPVFTKKLQAMFTQKEDEWEKNRLGFAKWITSKKNPPLKRRIFWIFDTITDMN